MKINQGARLGRSRIRSAALRLGRSGGACRLVPLAVAVQREVAIAEVHRLAVGPKVEHRVFPGECEGFGIQGADHQLTSACGSNDENGQEVINLSF